MLGKHLRDEISARADGEDPGLPDDEIDRHIARCSSCREFAESIDVLRARTGMIGAMDRPDISRRVVTSIGRDNRRRASAAIRWLLGACAVVLIAVAVPDLIGSGSAGHDLRHIAAFRLAYAVGLLGVVARPARARTMFYVSVVLVCALVTTSVADLIRGGLDLMSESLHLVQIVTAGLLWVLSRPVRIEDAATPEVEPTVSTGRPSRAGADRVLHLIVDDTPVSGDDPDL